MAKLNLRKKQTLIWFGCNEHNQSRFSSKVYMAWVHGCNLIIQFGAADIRNRCIEMRWIQTRKRTFLSNADAKRDLNRLILVKLSQGYERSPIEVSISKTITPRR